MKIGILTFWWSNDNYGQLMQCYALQKYLRDAGHDAYLIRYDSRVDYKKTPLPLKLLKALNPVKLFKYFNYKIHSKKISEEQAQNPRFFDDFRNIYITCSEKVYYSYKELQDNPPEADAYIVGSDQVWNYNLYSKNAINGYFLNFGSKKTLRLSYAASWGIASIDEKYKETLTQLLSRFDYIGVREESGIELCKDCGYENAEWVPDPTMLLQADTYRSIYKESEIRQVNKPFLLLYMLGNTNDFEIQKAYDFAEQKGLDVVYVSGNDILDTLPKYFATIPEWLYLIDNAEYIITNSFHCCVFSTLFNKKYGVIKLTGNWSGANKRLESLFERFKIEPRYISNEDLSSLEKDYVSSTIEISARFMEKLTNV